MGERATGWGIVHCCTSFEQDGNVPIAAVRSPRVAPGCAETVLIAGASGRRAGPSSGAACKGGIRRNGFEIRFKIPVGSYTT